MIKFTSVSYIEPRLEKLSKDFNIPYEKVVKDFNEYTYEIWNIKETNRT